MSSCEGAGRLSYLPSAFRRLRGPPSQGRRQAEGEPILSEGSSSQALRVVHNQLFRLVTDVAKWAKKMKAARGSRPGPNVVQLFVDGARLHIRTGFGPWPATASVGVETDEADVERLFGPIDSGNQKHDLFEWGLAVIAWGYAGRPAHCVEGRPGDRAAA